MTEKQIIPLNKKKIVGLFVMALVFMGIGVYMLNSLNETMGASTFLLRAVGIIALAFFGFMSFALGKKLFAPQDGLILTKEGFEDKASGMKIGVIAWKDVEKFEMVESKKGTPILRVFVKNPKKYLDKAPSTMLRKVMEMAHQQNGTPIIMTVVDLKIGMEDLAKTLLNWWTKNK